MGRPATAFMPMFVCSLPSKDQASVPSSCTTNSGARSSHFFGIRPSKVSGGSMRWSSTEMIRYGRGRRSGSGRNSTWCGSARSIVRKRKPRTASAFIIGRSFLGRTQGTRLTTIDHELAAGAIRAVITREKERQPRDLFGLGNAAEGQVLRLVVDALGGFGGAEHRRVDPTGMDRVDANVVGTEFDRRDFGEPACCKLGRHIRCGSGNRTQTGDRR